MAANARLLIIIPQRQTIRVRDQLTKLEIEVAVCDQNFSLAPPARAAATNFRSLLEPAHMALFCSALHMGLMCFEETPMNSLFLDEKNDC